MKFLFIQKLHAFNMGLFNRFMAQRTLLGRKEVQGRHLVITHHYSLTEQFQGRSGAGL